MPKHRVPHVGALAAVPIALAAAVTLTFLAGASYEEPKRRAPAIEPRIGPGSPACAIVEEEEQEEGGSPTGKETTPSVEAAFGEESYAQGDAARLVISSGARGLTLQLFRIGPQRTPTAGTATVQGIAVTSRRPLGTSSGRLVVPVSVGDWPSGLYFARLEAADGLVGFAPFIIRPARLGEHRVAIVLPTLTWQAYNMRDDDGDGQGDTWYAPRKDRWTLRKVRLGRPFLNRGIPRRFHLDDLPFLRWLAGTRREVDVLAQSDLESSSPRALAESYDLIVFPGHHEYVTTSEYDAIEGYRDLGGNLAFLSANNFFWRVVRRGHVMEKTRVWRDLCRPEAELVGVQYRGNDGGRRRGPFIVGDAPAVSWIFAGTGLVSGSAFGKRWGIEIDQTFPASPRNIQVIAEIPNLFGRGFTAQMTYYETPAGAKVFAAGAFSLAGLIDEPTIARVATNLWRRLSDP